MPHSNHTRHSSLEVTRPLTPNGNGINLYLPPEFVGHLGCPLEPGGETTAVTVPNVGVVLFPDDGPDLPSEIDVRPPEAYRVTIDTDLNPDPNTESESMIHTDTTDDSPRGETDGA